MPAEILEFLGRTAATFLTVLVAGCASHTLVPYDPQRSSPPDATSAREPIYPYQRRQISVDNQDLSDKETDSYDVRHLELGLIDENGRSNNRLTGVYFQGKAPGRKPLVIVLPIWGSYTYPPYVISAGLRRRSEGGINVLRLAGESFVLDWEDMAEAPTEEAFLDAMAAGLTRVQANVVDVSRIIDWAETQPDIDPGRIGLIGFSHGALTAGLVAVNEPRLAATVIVMGGAYPHRIFATCPGRVGKLREIIIDRFDWTVEEYQAALEPVVRPYDAATYPGRADPARILIIDAAKDHCIPADARDALWEVLGRPQRISLDYGHKKAFLSMTPLGFNWMRKQIYRFFELKLGPEDGS
jgi:dienelactone hydrolase